MFCMASIIVYFSRKGSNWVKDGVKNIEVGNCELFAKYLKNLLQNKYKEKCDVFKIETKKQYTDDYYKATEEAKKELNDGTEIEILHIPNNLSSYNKIILGFPIWWGTYPMAVASFLRNVNLENKTIIPFCTHEGSDVSNSLEDLKKTCKNSIIKDCFETRGYRCQDINNDDELKSEIENWIEKNF